jgi:hypothetical protein
MEDPASLVEVVAEHYKSPEAPPLLLANLGLMLRKSGIWQEIESSQKNLRQYIESFSPTLHIVRDPSSPARIAVADDEHLAAVEAALSLESQATSQSDIDLTKIPRSILLAFCVNQKQGESVWLKKTPPHFYKLQRPGVEELSDFWEIQPKYRMPKLRLSDPRKLPNPHRNLLERKIQDWRSDLRIPSSLLEKQSPIAGKNALLRLIEAQSAEIRRSLLIPADIAVFLSERE